MIESNVSIKLESFKAPDMVNEEDRFKAPQYPPQAPVPSNGWIAPTLSTRLFDTMVEGPGMRELIEMGFLTEYRVFAPPSDFVRPGAED